LAICAADFQDVKDAQRLTSSDLVDHEQLSNFLHNLHEEKIFEQVSEQSKASLHQTLPTLKAAADAAEKKEASIKHHYASLVAQLENLNDDMKALDNDVHAAKLKLAAAHKLSHDANNADLQIQRLKSMVESEESRRLQLASSISSLKHSEQLMFGHLSRALHSSQANIPQGTVEGNLIDDAVRTAREGVGSALDQVSAHLQQLSDRLNADIAHIEAIKANGRWRLVDDSTNTNSLDD
jgi:chromosome segregation ATPase